MTCGKASARYWWPWPWTRPRPQSPRSSTPGWAARTSRDEDVAEIRRIIEESGALQATEVLINEFGAAAFDALEALPLDELPKTALRRLAEATVSRAS